MLKPLYRMLIRKRSSRLQPWGRDSDELAYSEWEYGLAKADWRKFYAGRLDLGGKRVLDIGCGLGGRTVFYAGLGPSRIIGIDIIEEHIDKSRKFAQAKGLEGTATFELADALSLPYEDASFDIAISENSFEHYADPERVVAETARVVKAGGLFVINFPQWGAPNGHHLDPWVDVSWAHLVLSTEDLLALAEETGGKVFAKTPDDAWRDKLKEKLEADLKHHAECLNRMSIKRFEELLSESDKWAIRHRRRTAAIWWLFPLKYIPGLSELMVGRNFYILERK
jgi:SAM-dependent methyltransferase